LGAVRKYHNSVVYKAIQIRFEVGTRIDIIAFGEQDNSGLPRFDSAIYNELFFVAGYVDLHFFGATPQGSHDKAKAEVF
jgi:hypothetical protein